MAAIWEFFNLLVASIFLLIFLAVEPHRNNIEQHRAAPRVLIPSLWCVLVGNTRGFYLFICLVLFRLRGENFSCWLDGFPLSSSFHSSLNLAFDSL